MFSLDLGSGESCGHAVPAGVAEAVTSARAYPRPVVPIQRQPAKMRWQRMAMHAPASERRR
jgi:hypothetical protein